MRLKCPSCGAEYEVAAHLIPQGGRHVQCTACHTRWFVNPAQEPEPSEDRIIERLEAWSSRPRPVPVPVPQPAPPGTAGRGAEDPDSGEVFVWESPAAAAESPAPATAASGTATAEAPAAAAPLPPGVPQPRAVPEGRDAPAEAEDPAEPAPPEPTPARSASRLDLAVDPDAPPPEAPAQSRFAKGLASVLAVFVLALAVYNFHDLIVARLPQAAPAIDAYVHFVDDLRQRLAEGLAAIINRA